MYFDLGAELDPQRPRFRRTIYSSHSSMKMDRSATTVDIFYPDQASACRPDGWGLAPCSAQPSHGLPPIAMR